MYSFNCEVCGKQCESKSNPDNWKNKICMDCRNKAKDSKQSNSYSKVSGAKPYQPKPAFDVEKEIDNLLDLFETISIKAEARGLEVPPANVAQWATSLIIQRDKN